MCEVLWESWCARACERACVCVYVCACVRACVLLLTFGALRKVSRANLTCTYPSVPTTWTTHSSLFIAFPQWRGVATRCRHWAALSRADPVGLAARSDPKPDGIAFFRSSYCFTSGSRRERLVIIAIWTEVIPYSNNWMSKYQDK